MIQPIQFFAAGLPKGQPRPKAFSRGGHARVYDPGTAEGWKGSVALAAKEHLPKQPLDIPLYVHLEFFFPRPKSHFRTGKLASQIRPDAPGYHTAKPDVDNAAKAVMDALTNLGFWRDDALVADLRVRKLYVDSVRTPGCIVRIREA